MPRKNSDQFEIVEIEQDRRLLVRGRSPRPLVVIGLILVVLAASLGAYWLTQGLRSADDLNGPHQQWHGVVVEHRQGTLLFTGITLRYSLVVGFIDRHDPSATFTVNVDAATFAAIPDGKLITLDLGPQTGHVYALATSDDGVAWQSDPLDPDGSQLRLYCWLLLTFGGLLILLGLVGLAFGTLGLVDLLVGTENLSGQVVDVIEGSAWRLPRVVLDRGSGALVSLALRASIFEKVCEDGGQSRMTFIVSRVLRHVRRARRQRLTPETPAPETRRASGQVREGTPSW